MAPRKKSILRKSNGQPASKSSEKGSSWLSRIHSKLSSSNVEASPNLAKQDLRRVTFSIARLATERCFSEDGSLEPPALHSDQQEKTGDCSKELLIFYEQACQLREEDAFAPFADILRSSELVKQFHLNTIDLSGHAISYFQMGPIVDILMMDTGVRSLNFSRCGLGDESIRLLLNSVLLKDHICSLNLAGNPFKSTGFKYIAIFVSETTRLESLDLSFCVPDRRAMQYLASGVRQAPSLTSLILHNNDISHNAVPWLAAMVLNEKPIEAYWRPNPDLHSLRGLRQLDLSGINFENGTTSLAKALSSNGPLSSLLLSCCHINSQGCASIFESLLSNDQLKMLDLSGNPICKPSDVGIHALQLALTRNSPLVDLNLGDTGLDAGAAIALAECLPVNTKLSRLDLSHNQAIPVDGVLALSVSLKLNSTLTFLDIDTPPSDIEEFSNLNNDIIARCTMNMERLENGSLQAPDNIPKATSSCSTLSSSGSSSVQSDTSQPTRIGSDTTKPTIHFADRQLSEEEPKVLSAYPPKEISLVFPKL